MDTIILIGLRASGKSTIAASLSPDAVDLDDRVARDLGHATPGEAWRAHGERSFRRAEARCLARELARRRGRLVLALGGGTPTAPGVAGMLVGARARGAAIVYLRADASALADRLRSGGHADRPSLTGLGTIGEVGEVLARRDPLYRRLATLVLDATSLDPARAAEVIRSWARGGHRPGGPPRRSPPSRGHR